MLHDEASTPVPSKVDFSGALRLLPVRMTQNVSQSSNWLMGLDHKFCSEHLNVHADETVLVADPEVSGNCFRAVGR